MNQTRGTPSPYLHPTMGPEMVPTPPATSRHSRRRIQPTDRLGRPVRSKKVRQRVAICTPVVLSGYPRHRENKGKWPKKIPVRENTGEILPKHREFGNFARENTGNFVCSSGKFPDPKGKDISVLPAKISIFSEDLDKAVLCM